MISCSGKFDYSKVSILSNGQIYSQIGAFGEVVSESSQWIKSLKVAYCVVQTMVPVVCIS